MEERADKAVTSPSLEIPPEKKTLAYLPLRTGYRLSAAVSRQNLCEKKRERQKTDPIERSHVFLCTQTHEPVL